MLEADGFLQQLQDDYIPHVLEMAVSEDPTDGTAMAIVLVVMRKDSGILLAIPEEFLSEEVIAAGLLAGPDELVGPSHQVSVAGGVWDPVTGGVPTFLQDATVPVVLVDMLPGVAEHLKIFDPSSDPVEVIQHFCEPRADLFPMPDALLAAAMEWITNPSAGERVNYYSAEDEGAEEQEVPVIMPATTPKAPSKAKGIPNGGQQDGGIGGGKGAQASKVKKPTVATLASSVESLVSALPAITNQLAELTRRQSLGSKIPKPKNQSFGASLPSLEESISFPILLASLPRWILKARTPFSGFFAKSFHISRCGSSPASVVFPLPLPQLGLFRGSGPKLGRRRWISLCRRRILHLLVVALNFLHFGFRLDILPLLGRRPNSLQLKVFDRLWSFLATCDAPGEFPISPGRSGPEFILRLFELQRFADECPHLGLDGYVDGGGSVGKVGKIGRRHRVDLGDNPGAFMPYRSLDASRLKLTGEGKWPLDNFLEDEFWLPYLEPAVLRHGLSIPTGNVPNFKLESREKNLELAMLWSTKGLLALFPDPPPGGATCRVFNCYKNDQVDRQIGDRRMPNLAERSLQGPSKSLPGGYLLSSLHVPRGCHLLGSATDRKDFYHQARVSRERSHTNALPFSYPRSTFDGTEALHQLEEIENLKKKNRSRRVVGDKLRGESSAGSQGDGSVVPAFASLYQGDHLGVEYALSAHHALLREGSLLSPENQIKGHCPFPLGPHYECLVIDDYVAMSVQPRGSNPLNSFAARALVDAKTVYQRHDVLGSPEKDIDTSSCFKAIGTQVNSSESALSRGIVLVSSPPEKIASLIALSCQVARLPLISRSLASRLAGCWTSVLLHRRCLSCVLDQIYQLGVREEGAEDEVLHFPRLAAQELLLCSVLSFVAGTDVSAPYITKIFATDASLHKGAITSRDVDEDVAKIAWLGGDKKGAYTKLDNPFSAALKARGLGDEDDQPADPLPAPSSGLDFAFDFVEMCGGSGVVSAHAARLGLTVCTPIELSDSPHFDLENPRLIEWICVMLQKNLFRSVMLEPPCTTCSAAAHPCVRSYRQPTGFDRLDGKTWLGNLLAFRCFTIMLCAYHSHRPNLLEQPFLSKMAWLTIWRFLLSLGFAESYVASCAFGSVHKKPFRLLSWGLDSEAISVRCPGGHKHVKIEGALTKPSSIYVPRLAEHFAKAFVRALKKIDFEERAGPNVAGLESVFLNDLLMTGDWVCDLQWCWQHATHINLLESNSYVTLLRMLASRGVEGRLSCLLDSRVAKGSHAKGRSSAKALAPSLKKAAAISIAAGLYGSFGFAPTRLNTADDPTRDKDVRPPSALSVCDQLPLKTLQKVHSFQFSRPVAGWLRLFILLSSIQGVVGSSGFVFGCSTGFCPSFQPCVWWTFVCFVLPVFVWLLPGLLIFTPKDSCRIHVAIAPCFLIAARAMPLTADSGEEIKRATRRGGVELFADRIVKSKTRTYRETLLEFFNTWLIETFSISLDSLLEARPVDAERVSELLTVFGKEMYYAGKPYGRYSETINAVAARKPAIRRNLGLAWDLAFSWQADEPREHHVAMPLSVLLAVCGLALLWGWPVEASVFALTWCGLLRIGETLAATRDDLVLPCDAAPGTGFALLRILQPKTRGRVARHQSSRIDPSDIIRLLTAVYKNSNRDSKLWSFSSTTLRRRLNLLLKALGLPTERSHGVTPFDLGSFRPGGATFLLQMFEDAEFVRRRGRWVSAKVLEVYLQEISTATFQSRITPEARQRIERVSQSFPRILEQAEWFLTSGIPPIAWRHLWST